MVRQGRSALAVVVLATMAVFAGSLTVVRVASGSGTGSPALVVTADTTHAAGGVEGEWRTWTMNTTSCQGVSGGCSRVRTHALEFTVECDKSTNCDVLLYPENGWPRATLTAVGQIWTASGEIPQRWRHTCAGEPVPTTWSLTVRSVDDVVVRDVLTAGIRGVYQEDGVAEACPSTSVMFELTATLA